MSARRTPTERTDSSKNTSFGNLNRQVGIYSLAAAAAGVSLLALAQPGVAEVIVTQKTIPIPMSNYHMPNPVKISLTNNGVDQVGLSLFSDTDPAAPYRGIGGGGAGVNSGFFGRTSYALDSAFIASALPVGAKIGPPKLPHFFVPGGLIERTQTNEGFKYSSGPWAGKNLQDRYIGVRFLIDGELHYGWIRLRISTNHHVGGPLMSAEVLAYAYETEPNIPVYAGLTKQPTAEVQPSQQIQNRRGPSLGMLAAGAEAVPLWRQKQ
jgi:hypothetical protein